MFLHNSLILYVHRYAIWQPGQLRSFVLCLVRFRVIAVTPDLMPVNGALTVYVLVSLNQLFITRLTKLTRDTCVHFCVFGIL